MKHAHPTAAPDDAQTAYRKPDWVSGPSLFGKPAPKRRKKRYVSISQRPLNRAAIHALLRKNGEGDNLDRLIALTDKHRSKFKDILIWADECRDDFRMRDLARKARAGLKAIEADLDSPVFGTHGSLGNWGPNGQASRIERMHADAQRLARSTFSMGVAA